MNKNLYTAVESAAKMANEEGDMFMASILYSVLGSYVFDGAQEMAKVVNEFTKRIVAENALSPEFPSSISVE